MNAQALVQTQQQGPVLVVSINNPPVNALGQGVRAGLLAAVEQLEQDAALKAMLIVGQGKAFIAGADIREFGKPPMAPALPDVLNRMETGSKLVVAAIHGPALGGGLEVAMATHFRVALAGAKLGLPEVNLGLLPGAGGTQRSPRLMGVKAATELMLSGQHLSAKAALAAGLVDKLAEGDDPLVAGLAYVNELLARGVPPRRTRDLAIADKAAALAELDAIALESVKKTRGLFSPAKIIECVRAAVELPFEQGLKRERELFLECLNSPQRQGLVHAFFAERETAKIPEAKAAAPRALASIAVIGGGTMGAGITVSALDAGLSVVMVERDAESIARGQKNVEKVYDGLIARGRMTAEAKAATMARYTPSTSYDAIKHVDLVIEAVFEDIEVKKAVFKELDRVCKSGAVLATNTSYLDIDAIAAVTSRPQDVIGLHFFSPANIMKLLEIVVPSKVAPDVVVTSFELAKRMKKVPVRAGVCDGFIGNRILSVYREAANYVLEDGASPYDIDAAVLRTLGLRPGQLRSLTAWELGPLVVFFFANSRGEWLAAQFPVLSEMGGPIFIATGLFMAATATALVVSWILTRTLPMMPLISGTASAASNSFSISTRKVDCTGSAPFISSSKLVNAYHQLAPSAVRMARSCICSLPRLGSTATTSWPCSFMRRRITVRVWASCSCVGSCCRAATACSIFSLPFRPLSLG